MDILLIILYISTNCENAEWFRCKRYHTQDVINWKGLGKKYLVGPKVLTAVVMKVPSHRIYHFKVNWCFRWRSPPSSELKTKPRKKYTWCRKQAGLLCNLDNGGDKFLQNVNDIQQTAWHYIWICPVYIPWGMKIIMKLNPGIFWAKINIITDWSIVYSLI
jgi:hypothetical protein